ncbi:hypothetical protein [Pseudomonas koreensis]|uniref:hypothetical protein n=1 Tax=Pseudomonas koreensis TaxID=198620 RepID=UPI0020773C5A|nr:hypothetical protein [Pseudomonas koreensis]MCM8742344.1 hypothetical protein [Pseudomonas koreensis]
MTHNKKRGKPSLSKEDKRTNKILVSFNADEYERLLSLMDDAGFDSPAIFLRSSGLRSQLPPKIVLHADRMEVYKLLSSSVKGLDLAIENGFHAQSIKLVRDHLVQIAKALIDVESAQGEKQ